jgi:hypothetical protein
VDLIERTYSPIRRHPWELARAQFFLRLLRDAGLLGRTTTWLDIGAGDAWFATNLRGEVAGDARLVCWDVNYRNDDLAALGSPGIELRADSPAGRFDAILLLDVLEHVDDDASFLSGIVRDLMTSTGFALLSVPAYQGLFSNHDRALGHRRRYSPRACRTLIESAGLAVQSEGGLFHSLLPVRAAQVGFERLGFVRGSTGVGSWEGGNLVTRVVSSVLRADTHLSRALGTRSIPVLPGLSYWALCRPEGQAR